LTRSSSYLLSAALLLCSAGSLSAQQDAKTGVATIIGLSGGDQLNVRASASAIGLVIGRLPNGSQVRTFECEVVNGNRWCKVEDIQTKQVAGWAPARYLAGDASLDADSTAAVGEADASRPDNVISPTAGAAASFGEEEYILPLSDLAPDQPETAALEKGVLAALSESIIPNAAAAAGPRSDANKPTGGLVPDQNATPEQRAMARIGALAVMPYATVLPDREFAAAEAGADAQIQAALSADTTGATAASAAPQSDVTGTIACARYFGQPMKSCEATVKRAAEGDATVTVMWSDGGQRTIRFRQGKPEGSDAAGDFRFTREAGLNLIRIGRGERFEIVDDLPFGR
jgi:hypothetical protein